MKNKKVWIRLTDTPEKREQKRVVNATAAMWSKRVWTGSGTIEVAVYQHMVQSPDGERAVHSIATKRSWKDGDNLKESRSFRPEDLLPLARVLGEAFDVISALRHD